MTKYKTMIFLAVIPFTIAACAYLGFHGPSVKMYPDIHENVSEDWQCLKCHYGDDPQGPVTPHPNFSGCLKCHSDEIHAYDIRPENRTLPVFADQNGNATSRSGSEK